MAIKELSNINNSILNAKFLDIADRPKELVETISRVFKKLKQNTCSNWGLYNGRTPRYNMVGINEHKLFKKIILQEGHLKKEFYFLDIGAGDFWGCDSLAYYINRKINLLKDVKVHIIGIRGERYLEEKITANGQCVIYKLGGFKVEELFSQFAKHGLDLKNKVDVMVSHWTFRHLVDPVGTFSEAYKLGREGTGYILIDSFLFLKNDDVLAHFHPIRSMIELFMETKSPFLINNSESSDPQFIIKKSSPTCELLMEYQDQKSLYLKVDAASNSLCRFKTSINPLLSINVSNRNRGLYGNLELYKDVLACKTKFAKDYALWRGSILKNSTEYADHFPCHDAIERGDIAAVQQLLMEGMDVNSKNQDEITLLDVAIDKKNKDVIKLLLDKGAAFSEYNLEDLQTLCQEYTASSSIA